MKKSKKEKILNNLLDTILRWCFALKEIFTHYSKESAILSFKRKIKRRGYKVFKYVEPDYFCQLYPEKTRDIVIEYYYKVPDEKKTFYLSCLYSSKNSDLFYFFLKEYEKYYDLYIQYQYLCELIQNCIYETRSLEWKMEYIKALTDSSIRLNLKTFYYICGDLQIEEAIPSMKEQVQYDNYYLHDIALNALKKYKNHDVKKALKNVEKAYDFYPFEVVNQMIEDGKIEFKENKDKSTVPKFVQEMKKSNEEVIEYCQSNPLQVEPVILNYYNQSTLISDKCFYIKCLMTKENTNLYPFLLNELRQYLSLKSLMDSICNSLNNAFFSSRNIKYKEEYIKIIENEKYIDYNYLIIKLCGKLQIIEIIPYLLTILKNENHPLKNHALETLSYYKNKKDYRDVFVKYSKSKDSYTKEVAKNALK